MPATETRRFYAYADAVGRSHGHTVEAESVEAAVVVYVEAWTPPVDGEGDVRVFVQDPEDGVERCFTLDLGADGEPQPCD